MYRIIDAKTGALIEEIIAPRWVKQQKRVDYPILCDFAEEADGIVLSDGDGVRHRREGNAGIHANRESRRGKF